VGRCSIQQSCDLDVRFSRRQREVARAFLDVARCVCQARVHLGAASGGNGVVDRGGKQRMGKADDAVRPECDGPGRNRLVERGLSVVDRARKDSGRRSFRSRRRCEQRQYRRRQTGHPFADELFERRRERQRSV
jgi:hypothetical protein